MLEKIIIKNVNSIDVCELDFAKGNYRYLEENVKGDIVNPVAIYGHNGSGKSAILNAVAQFIGMMSLPVEALSPFAVNDFLIEKYIKGQRKDKSLIQGSVELFFNIDGKAFDYFLQTSRDNYVSSEYLKVDANTYFEINDGKYYFDGGEFSIENKTTSRLVPFLRVLASSEITNSTIQTVFNYIKSFTHVNAHSSEVKDILKQYNDFSVYSIEKDDAVMPNGLVSQQCNVVFEDKGFKGKIPFRMVSTGMQNQSVLLSILLSMPKSSVLFIDDADLALHPSALNGFLDTIRHRDIQVIMTLHNTNAMQSLRPDQIFFTYWSKGFSTCRRLSKIYPNIREINNIEKMYLSSTFDREIKDCK